MKIKVACFFSGLLIVGSAMSQERSGKKSIEKGEQSASIYYGLNYAKNPNEPASVFSSFNGATFSSPGTFGADYEYLVSGLLGLGAEVNYTRATVVFDITDPNMSPNAIDRYYNRRQFSTLRTMARADFHILMNSRLDVYFLGALGGRYTVMRLET